MRRFVHSNERTTNDATDFIKIVSEGALPARDHQQPGRDSPYLAAVGLDHPA